MGQQGLGMGEAMEKDNGSGVAGDGDSGHGAAASPEGPRGGVGPREGRPVIGITMGDGGEDDYRSQSVSTDYVEAVAAAGGLPLLIPFIPDARGENITAPDAAAILAAVDGLLLTGGPDVDPVHYGQEPRLRLGRISPPRDALEISLTRRAAEKGIPFLGICRGMQVLNAALGGTLYQDIPSMIHDPVQHRVRAPRWYGSHSVWVEEGSLLARLIGAGEVRVNSFHHQAIDQEAPDLAVTARAADGITEAVELPSHPFALGVQWHPEAMWGHDERWLALFRGLVDAAGSMSGGDPDGDGQG